MATKPQRVIVCPHCSRAEAADVRGSAFWDGRNFDSDWVDFPIEWTLLQCQYCKSPVVQKREDFGGGFDADEPAFLYPSPRRLSSDIPQTLRREWEEAQTCFDAKGYAACLVMTRRALEGTCVELGVKKGTLAKDLKELEKQGTIDGMLAEWASALRVAGNQGAHFTGEEVSREAAEDVLAFTEAFLDHVYVLRKRFHSFQARLKGESQ